MAVSSLVLVVLTSFFFWIGYAYLHVTKPIPKKGGDYTEGIVGQPLYINPLLSQSSEADSDLSQLIYSGLFKYDKDGKLLPDLAERYDFSDDQGTYTIYLKNNILWQDGQPLTADDVIFTINAIQDPSYKSPLRPNWQGVTAEKIDDHAIRFILKVQYFGFLDNLTVGILPKHIWSAISPENFSLSQYNLKPIGSGPFKYFNIEKDASGNIVSYQLSAFEKYYGGAPYIQRMIFDFYSDEDSMVVSYNKKQIMGMGNVLPQNVQNIKNVKSTNINQILIPRYFSIFLNITKSLPLADDNVRKALSFATDKNEILGKVLLGKGASINSPIFTGTDAYNNDIEKYDFNLNTANRILDEAGWKRGEDGIRAKNGNKLQFDIYTTDWPELSTTAQILSEQWKKIGVEADTQILTVSDLQQNFIRTRNYDSLLFGQASTFSPDLYAFWHSSQKQDPGLNLSVFNNSDADDLLASARQEMDASARNQNYKDFQQILSQKVPAIFLYSPFYIYPVSKEVKGIDAAKINSPSWRFADVNKWYIKTKRILK
jgi:peptide/nickel transport system substrate-binding protein